MRTSDFSYSSPFDDYRFVEIPAEIGRQSDIFFALNDVGTDEKNDCDDEGRRAEDILGDLNALGLEVQLQSR